LASSLELQKITGADFVESDPWPTDRVQLGLQAILLERRGYKVRESMLFYADALILRK